MGKPVVEHDIGRPQHFEPAYGDEPRISGPRSNQPNLSEGHPSTLTPSAKMPGTPQGPKRSLWGGPAFQSYLTGVRPYPTLCGTVLRPPTLWDAFVKPWSSTPPPNPR